MYFFANAETYLCGNPYRWGFVRKPISIILKIKFTYYYLVITRKDLVITKKALVIMKKDLVITINYLVITREDLVITRKESRNYEKNYLVITRKDLVITRKLSRNNEKIKSLLRENCVAAMVFRS